MDPEQRLANKRWNKQIDRGGTMLGNASLALVTFGFAGIADAPLGFYGWFWLFCGIIVGVMTFVLYMSMKDEG